jgi:ATP-binding cassette subfamily B protein
MFIPVTHVLPALSYLITLLYGGYLVINHAISLGDLVAFYSYLGLIIWPVMGLGWLINLVQRGTASMERINQILDTQSDIVDIACQAPCELLKGCISITQLNFTYPSRMEAVLKNFSIHVPEGTTLGIVGKTGSGKTTIAQLLLHLYEVPYGTIYFDGQEVHDIPLAVLRQSIGYVPQDAFLFSSSIKDNIAFDREYTDEQLQQAIRVAQIDKDIQGFSDGVNTVIGERGITLSGGQKQRVAIARAIIKDPPILIFDDSFSAVDSQTQRYILQQLKSFRKGKTTIVISHRISTLQDADQIIVLDEGRIIEQGNHQELMHLSGVYARMYQTQMLQDEINAAKGAE